MSFVKLTKPRLLSHILKQSYSFVNFNETLNERAAYPHASAQRHTARPPTAKGSTPSASRRRSMHSSYRISQQAALPSHLGARLHTQTGSKQTALTATITHQSHTSIRHRQNSQQTAFAPTTNTVADSDCVPQRPNSHANNQTCNYSIRTFESTNHSFIHTFITNIHSSHSSIRINHSSQSFNHSSFTQGQRAGGVKSVEVFEEAFRSADRARGSKEEI